ncbi:fibrobacter succinogenes major paralogous domain-containing protein [Lentimicrobium sp.]|uniref:fibrobacter succinogenes major paralogous domain-containing protein n=1 Tax=Lentimicrobium sp. TaxID=2034841 RepID=UPI002C19B74A|nr:fibrobacter succinogenes major paralogous domain-containing protein [Lentimicrobium sp.]HRW67942.1 fibrobacter succinogenes major paralogous domain-containing protein [Lentimicrobium sp.]
MKRIVAFFTMSVLLAGMAMAQNETMYIHLKTGAIANYPVNDIDSIVFYDGGGGNSVTDIDGNVYIIIEIGPQSWLGQNLKTTRYNDGTPIPLQTDAGIWDTLSTHAYCWYENDIAYKEPYGALYNWHVINMAENGGKNVCPIGWHVPEDDEWTALTDYLGGHTVAGGKLKEAGTTHWTPPNSGATNETGFTALPGGERGTGGAFAVMDSEGNWWTAYAHPTYGSAYYRSMGFASASVYRTHLSKTFGMSIRCISD